MMEQTGIVSVPELNPEVDVVTKGEQLFSRPWTMTFLSHRAVMALLLGPFNPTLAFITPTQCRRLTCLKAAPKRLEENVNGVLYVNDKVSLFISSIHLCMIHTLTL